MSADMEGVNAVSGSTCTMCLHTCDHALALATQRAELAEKVRGLARYSLGQGEPVHSGIEIVPDFYGQLLERDDVLSIIEGSKG